MKDIYQKMRPVVNVICESMLIEPNEWDIGPYSITHPKKI